MSSYPNDATCYSLCQSCVAVLWLQKVCSYRWVNKMHCAADNQGQSWKIWTEHNLLVVIPQHSVKSHLWTIGAVFRKFWKVWPKTDQVLLRTNADVHSVNTRNKCHLHRPVANISCFQKSAYYARINIFNNLPSGLKSLMNEKAKFNTLKLSGYYTYHLL
jgi:hypothetical protein